MLLDAFKNQNMQQFQDMIQQTVSFDDPKMAPHLSKILQFIKSPNYKNQSLIQVSNIIKQATPKVKENFYKESNLLINNRQQNNSNNNQKNQIDCQIRNFKIQSQKFQWVGISFTQSLKQSITKALITISDQYKVKELRFWGKIFGVHKDYYIIQGVKQPPKSHDTLSKGQQKSGEGVNYYSFWVTNDPEEHQKWIQLPNITPELIKTARKIKCLFTGNLQNNVNSFPAFKGHQKHYLKSQLCRMTHGLQLSPKGIYKIHDENPKVIQYEEQVKVPQFAQLNSLETWVHKNQFILNLGRCSHYVDPSLPQDQIQAVTSQLAQKDPQIQRLRGITQDKLLQNFTTLYGGIQNTWTIRVQGDNQVFTKQQAQLVYGVVVLKNLYWPGWMTIGYKGGYSNIYVGRGVKSIQDSWSLYENPNVCQDAQQLDEYPEPNPKQLPPPPQQPKQGEQNPPEQ